MPLGSEEHPCQSLQHAGSGGAGVGANGFSFVTLTHCGANGFDMLHFQDAGRAGTSTQCLEHVTFEMYDPLSGGGQKYESDEPAHATHVFSHHNWQVDWFCGPGWETLLLHPPLLQHAGCGGGGL